MTDNTNQAPEDLGAPVAFLVLTDGTRVYDRAGDAVGTVAHVLADEREEVFHGLLLDTASGHRYASAAAVDGIFEHGVIVAEPADRLPEPSEKTAREAEEDEDSGHGGLRRAWEWLIQPK